MRRKVSPKETDKVPASRSAVDYVKSIMEKPQTPISGFYSGMVVSIKKTAKVENRDGNYKMVPPALLDGWTVVLTVGPVVFIKNEAAIDSGILLHDLDGTIDTPSGLFIEKNNIVPQAGCTQPPYSPLEEGIRNMTGYGLTETATNIKTISNEIAKNKREMERLDKEIASLAHKISAGSEHLITLRSLSSSAKKDSLPGIVKLINNGTIVAAHASDDAISCITRPLMFDSPRNHKEKFPLGQYIISILRSVFSGKGKGGIYVENLTRLATSGDNPHPCVHSMGHTLCLGSNASNMINSAIATLDIPAIISIVIDFLETPNYGTPFKDACFFVNAPERKLVDGFELESLEDLFNEGVFNKNVFVVDEAAERCALADALNDLATPGDSSQTEITD